jgi:AMP nucleosidase
MDLLSAIEPKAVLFLGKCGGLKKEIRSVILFFRLLHLEAKVPANDYFPPEVPALPAFMLQKAISTTIRDYECDYWTGTVYTTNRRVWEHDEAFKEYLQKSQSLRH